METNSKSVMIEYNCTDNIFTDENDKSLNGTCLLNGYIMRFKDGKLDGGNAPAIEGKGHIEYWKDNKIQSVSSEGFTWNEEWNNGVFVKLNH